MSEIRPLTSLRFVAALYVFIFHIHIRWPVGGGAVDNLLSAGAIGMSLFFMLSGFILGHRYQSGRIDLREYLTNRFARIYPVYAVAAIVTLPWILGADADQTGLVVNAAKAALLVVADTLLIQAWFPQMFAYWNNGGSWSISVEAFFYVLFPAVFPLLFRASFRQILAVGIGVYLLAILIGGVIAAFVPRPTPILPIFYAMPIFRLPEFVLGICAFLAWHRGRLPAIRSDVLYLGGTLVLVLYLAVLGKRIPLFILHNWLVLPVFALLLTAGMQQHGTINRMLSHWLPVWLGRISYCFYSFQLLILVVLLSYHDPIVRALPALADNHLLLAVSFVILLALSAIGYHLIEEPARRAIRRKSRRRIPAVQSEDDPHASPAPQQG